MIVAKEVFVMKKVSTTGERIKAAMLNNGMRQADLVQATGLGKSAISQYISDKVTPKQDKVYLLARALNVSESWLMGLDVNPDRVTPNMTPYRPTGQIPILGTIPAGIATLAVEDIEGYTAVDVCRPEECFALRMKGDSMINAGIYPDDLVIIRMQNYAENGQIVACRINGDESTLKRFTKQDDTIVLVPENPKYPVQIVNAADFESGYASVIGVAIEIKRILI